MKLQHFIFNGKTLNPLSREMYLESYKIFKSVWQTTLSEIYGESFQLFSNDFTRQDRIHALFSGPECVALTCLRQINLDNPVDFDDSWLKVWTSEHYKKLKLISNDKCYIHSYFTVNPKYRRTQSLDIQNCAQTLGCLTFIEQLEMDIPLVLGMMRTDRSMHKLGQQWGSLLLEEAINYNNTKTDLVIFTKESVEAAAKNYPQSVFDLWNNRIDHTKEFSHENIKRVA